MTSFKYDIDNATELRLGLPRTCPVLRDSKRSLTDANSDGRSNSKSTETDSSNQEAAPLAKAQVVGWPPIRSYGRNNFHARKTEDEVAVLYVKVVIDGAPYLRKIDLKTYKGYTEFREALEDMFNCFSLGDLVGMERRKRSDYAVTYEDKDGDWMLVGDVSWEMFISSCKRLRIMRVNQARGLSSNS